MNQNHINKLWKYSQTRHKTRHYLMERLIANAELEALIEEQNIQSEYEHKEHQDIS